jgi:prepilin-type processing-associated H-X9-DG protein
MSGDQPALVAGSYMVNGWLGPDSSSMASGGPLIPIIVGMFGREEAIVQPTLTPVVCDGIWWGGRPRVTDRPATNLVMGDWSSSGDMLLITIPRHGSRPNPVPRNHPPEELLPGAINASFYDGHAETERLERLWELYWHRDYQPPSKRPGLP